MKRIIVLAALLAAASACAPAEQANTNNSNLAAANANNAATPQASPASVSDADIIAQERQLLDALKAKNWDAFAAKLADDQIYVSGEGVYDKSQSVEGVKKTDFKEFTTSDMKVLKLGQNAAVLTYTNVAKGTYEGKPLPDTPSRDTSIWVNRGGKWLAVFHQETYAQPPATPGASPGNSNSASSNSNTTAPGATASPAATAAAAPANVTDAEKQVWDLLKAKNWDGFAAFITSDFVEVEPEGVTDKAGSVAGVKQIDFSTAALSDFKEVKIDADASILTYVVKGKGKDWPPKGARHTTVWVNRGGKWQAAFHQGTIIER
ncbi:MAG: nuclear transport factor 2 family protein [Acidobacteria bacterium]|nr:nuclear transport factor 2 family protein [Acidobacteriota bacterium]